MITEQEGTEILDMIEDLLVIKTISLIQQLAPEMLTENADENKKMARNLIAKIGSRIMVGKETLDHMILKDMTVKTRRGHSPSNQ